jgi:Zn-dependent protease with chaperone function
MGDAFVYYMMTTGVGLALFHQVLGNWRTLSNEIVLAIMALLGLISIRSYCRTRELAADAISSIMLAGKLKDELAQSRILGANRVPFLRTHPSVRERLAVLDSPIAMLDGMTFIYFASGYMSVSVALALHRVLYDEAYAKPLENMIKN